MRLIRCHVENFGRLSGFDFEFLDGCNAVTEDNGWGKSTFATFIKVMFFGFSGEGKRNELECERKRYTPWQGGVYGGYVVFEKEGKIYKLTRHFANKANEDFFELRDFETNLLSDVYDENIGKTLFEVDGESFIRTAYISQNDIKIEMNAEISAKMGGLAGLSDDLSNYDKADKQLQEWLNANTKKRKTGKLAALEAELTNLKHEVQRADILDGSIDELNAKKKQLQEKKVALEAEQNSLMQAQKVASEQKATQHIKNQYDEICVQVQDRQRTKESARNAFPGNIPEQNELEQILEEAGQLETKSALVAQYALTDSAQNRLTEGMKAFESQEPDVVLLGEYYESLSKNIEEKLALAPNVLSSTEVQKLDNYRNIYGDADNCDRASAEIYELEKQWGERARANDKQKENDSVLAGYKDEYDALLMDASAFQKALLGYRVLAGLLILVSIILMAAGVVYDNGYMIAGLVLGSMILFVGIVFLLMDLMNRGKCKANQHKVALYRNKMMEIQGQMESWGHVVSRYDRHAKDFLKQYGEQYDEYAFLTVLGDKKNQIREYRELMQKKVVADSASNRMREVEESEQAIRSYVMQFLPDNAEGDLQKAIIQVREMYKEYVGLKEQKEKHTVAEISYRNSLHHIQEYLRLLHMLPAQELAVQLKEVRDNLIAYHNADKEHEDAVARKHRFEEEHPNLQNAISVEEQEDTRTLDEINRVLADMPKEINLCADNIRDYEQQMNQLLEERMLIGEKENLLAVKQEESDSLQKMYGLVNKTRELLQEAKESFTTKYIGPTQDAFRKYYSIVENSNAERYHFDANMNITSTEFGRDREIGFLSRGYQDLVGVCYRLAVLDAMYTSEKPLILLDDPFVNLDDEKFAGAMKLLKKVSEEYQVVYFNCRSMESK